VYLFNGNVQLQVVLQNLAHIRGNLFEVQNQLGDANIMLDSSAGITFLPCNSRNIKVGEVGVSFEGLHESLLSCLAS
jgi:hypothetical protein